MRVFFYFLKSWSKCFSPFIASETWPSLQALVLRLVNKCQWIKNETTSKWQLNRCQSINIHNGPDPKSLPLPLGYYQIPLTQYLACPEIRQILYFKSVTQRVLLRVRLEERNAQVYSICQLINVQKWLIFTSPHCLFLLITQKQKGKVGKGTSCFLERNLTGVEGKCLVFCNFSYVTDKQKIIRGKYV